LRNVAQELYCTNSPGARNAGLEERHLTPHHVRLLILSVLDGDRTSSEGEKFHLRRAERGAYGMQLRTPSFAGGYWREVAIY
jgi:hypothetical protein